MLSSQGPKSAAVVQLEQLRITQDQPAAQIVLLDRSQIKEPPCVPLVRQEHSLRILVSRLA